MPNYYSISGKFRLLLALFFVVVLVLCCFNVVLCVKYFTMRSSVQLSNDISREEFSTMLSSGVSNYFSHVTSFRSVASASSPTASPSVPSLVPTVYTVPDLGVWHNGCSFGGCSYYVGDYSSYGRLVSCNRNSAYWLSPSNTVVILKSSFVRQPFDPWSSSSASAAGSSRASATAAEADEGAPSW